MRCRRRAAAVLEVTLAVVLLSLIFLAVAHLLTVTARVQREAQWRSLATREAANLMERVMTRSWNDLSREAIGSLEPAAIAQLPGSQVRVAVELSPGPPEAKKIHVQIDWVNLAGQRVQPVELVAWKHRLPMGANGE